MVEYFDLLQEAIKNNKYNTFSDTIREKISTEEKLLESLIVDSQSILINNCTMMSNLSIKNTLNPITEKIKDSSISLLITHKQSRENKELVTKTANIFDLLLLLKQILDKLNNTGRFYEDCLNFQYVSEKVRLFRKYRFYDDLKVLYKQKRAVYIDKLHEQADEWLIEMMNLYNNLGDRVMTKNEIFRDELQLSVILEPLYLFKRLDMGDEFCEYLNSKRININKHLKICEMIGFLYVEDILCKIDEGFKIHDFNVNYEKEELIILIFYLKKYNYSYKKQERVLEKTCCDYIFKNREEVHSKEETERFFKKTSDFLTNVDQSCVIEIFYKCLDDMIVKYYNHEEINEAIDRFKSFKGVEFDFRSLEKAKEMLQTMKSKVDEIFENEGYEELKGLVLSRDIIIYIKDKFIEKLGTVTNIEERKFEAEAVKFYVYLQKIKLDCANIFDEAIEFSKTRK